MKYITRKSELVQLAITLADEPYFAFDTETSDLDVLTARLFLLSIADSTGTQYVVNLLHFTKKDMQILKPVFESFDIIKIAHNASYDWKVLFHHYGIHTNAVYDTLLAEQAINAGLRLDNALDGVLLRRMSVVLDKSIRSSFIHKQDDYISSEQIRYSAEDVQYLPKLRAMQLDQLRYVPYNEIHSLEKIVELECSIIPVTALMELTGIPLNKQMLDDMREPFTRYIEQIDSAFQALLLDANVVDTLYLTPEGPRVINSASTDQVLEVFHKLGIQVESLDNKVLAKWDVQHAKKSSKLQVTFTHLDTDVLESFTEFTLFVNPYLKAYTYLKGLRILLSTFIIGISNAVHAQTGRVHANFNQLGAESTGRYSSSKPNFQNIPNDTKLERLGLERYSIRKCIQAPKGKSLIISDYSGIELVILAVLSNDTDLLYQITQGDIHTLITREILGYKEITAENKKKTPHKRWRDAAKKLSYSIAYGTTGRNAAETLNLDLAEFNYKITAQEGDELIERWYSLFPKTAAYLQSNARKAQRLSEIQMDIATWRQSSTGVTTLVYKREYVSFVTDTWGRRRHWRATQFYESYADDSKKAKWLKLAAGREGMNAPIQGTSATMTKRAMALIYNRLDKRQARIIISVHDEIVVETAISYQAEAERIIKEGMEQAIKETLPSIVHMVGMYESLSAAPKSSERYDK